MPHKVFSLQRLTSLFSRRQRGYSPLQKQKRVVVLPALFMLLTPTFSHAADPGVYGDKIVLGGVLDLEGQSRGLGIGMREGIIAAFSGVTVQGKRLEYRAENDSYTPELTQRQTQRLINEGIFAMVGNVGTPTAKVALPILADNNVPAIGFFTGAGLLRPGTGNIINYRASYVQETAAVIEQSFEAGIKPKEICAYVQNDAYGMAGVAGIKVALQNRPQTREIVARLDELLEKSGDNPNRNGIGPVGVYQRNTLSSRAGYDSLKQWESSQNTTCKLVVTVGTYSAIGRFAAYSRQKGNQWLISAVSFTGADNLQSTLEQFGVTQGVILTQVVPAIDSDLAIVKAAQKALKDRLNVVSLEGYIVGRMVVEMLQRIDGEITREKFIAVARGSNFTMGGLKLDFQRDNQASDMVSVTYFKNKTYQNIDSTQLSALF
ncbi:ABC transporter substrate-binding protein [Oleiphilus messinensis]|nr:ABC transporter substrate-binding protein [Oleiphilus messinensis]